MYIRPPKKADSVLLKKSGDMISAMLRKLSTGVPEECVYIPVQ